MKFIENSFNRNHFSCSFVSCANSMITLFWIGQNEGVVMANHYGQPTKHDHFQDQLLPHKNFLAAKKDLHITCQLLKKTENQIGKLNSHNDVLQNDIDYLCGTLSPAEEEKHQKTLEIRRILQLPMSIKCNENLFHLL